MTPKDKDGRVSGGENSLQDKYYLVLEIEWKPKGTFAIFFTFEQQSS